MIVADRSPAGLADGRGETVSLGRRERRPPWRSRRSAPSSVRSSGRGELGDRSTAARSVGGVDPTGARRAAPARPIDRHEQPDGPVGDRRPGASGGARSAAQAESWLRWSRVMTRDATRVADRRRQHPHIRRQLRGVLDERRRRLDEALREDPAHRVRPVRAPVDRHGGTRPDEAQRLGRAQRIEVQAATEGRTPAPDGDEREVDRPAQRRPSPSNRSVSPAK